jgi:outer membrane translocation and assembly module TamA
MRKAAAIPIFLCLITSVRGQNSTPTPQHEVRVRNLTIVSTELPEADRQRIIGLLRGQAYVAEEFQERVRFNLRNLGYYNARVDEAELSGVREGQAGESADVSIKVEPGAQYRFGVIEFKHVTLFQPDQLRSLFTVKTGSLFNATSLSYGLERLKNLYQDEGYVNFGAIPMPAVDEAHHVVDLMIDIDEGNPYVFGRLVLDGIEPHTGAGQDLINSWNALQGKRYNPQQLKSWLASNWAGGAQAANLVHNDSDADLHQVNLRLQFP